MSNRFKVKGNIQYLNMTGQIVGARAGTVVVMPRRSDVKKYIASGDIEPADGQTRAAHTMTSANIDVNTEETNQIIFEVEDFVGFEHEGEEVSGEVKSVSPRGILAVDIGTVEEEKIVRVNPDKMKVVCH
jgi:hypothetical protein